MLIWTEPKIFWGLNISYSHQRTIARKEKSLPEKKNWDLFLVFILRKVTSRSTNYTTCIDRFRNIFASMKIRLKL